LFFSQLFNENIFTFQAVKDGTKTFDNLISEGVLEFLDVNEINNARISVYEHQIISQTTHLEVKIFFEDFFEIF